MLGWQAVRMTAAAADTPSPARPLAFHPHLAAVCTGCYPVGRILNIKMFEHWQIASPGPVICSAGCQPSELFEARTGSCEHYLITSYPAPSTVLFDERGMPALLPMNELNLN